ncbi:unnamed protein product [Caenorhabditis brenneri]
MWIINFKVSQLHKTTGFDPDQCLNLLLKFGFDKKAVLKTCNEQFLTALQSKTEQDEPEECYVCCLDNQIIRLDCGHSACRNCWKSYLIRKIEDGNCLIECMDPKCKLLIGKSVIDEFMDDVASYESLIINSFVKANNTITKCPDATCKLFAKTSSAEPQTVTCTCNRIFCSSCGQDPHFPATCRQRQLWNKKCELLTPQIDDDSQQWLLEHTKECPRCLMTVEKQGGCTLMTCSNKKCRLKFCWSCRSDIATHGIYYCNSSQLKDEEARLDARADLANFITHYNRLEYYQNFLKNIPPIISDALESSEPLLQKVTNSYVNARKILINSVVFGFFLRTGEYSDELKKLQHELELSTDQLESSLLNYLPSQGSKKVRSELFEHHQDIEKCQKELLELCANGKEFEDLNGQSYRDAWKRAHDARVNNDSFSQFFSNWLFASVLILALLVFLPDFNIWLPDFSVAYGKTLGIDLRDDTSQLVLRTVFLSLVTSSVVGFFDLIG